MGCLTVTITPFDGIIDVVLLYDEEGARLYSSDGYALNCITVEHDGYGMDVTFSCQRGLDVSITQFCETKIA